MKRIYLVIILIVLLIIDNTLLPYYAIGGAFPSLIFKGFWGGNII